MRCPVRGSGQIAFSASDLFTGPQGTVFVQVAEHLDADGLVQAAYADRVEVGHADQASDQVSRGGVVVGGVEQHRSLGLPPCCGGQRGS